MTDDTRDPKRPKGLRLTLKAMGNTLNLVTLGAGGLAAAALHSVPLLALGGLAYGALVAWDLVNPKFRAKADEPEPIAFPDPDDFRDLAVRAAMKKLVKGHTEVDRVLDELGDTMRAELGLVLASLRVMEEHAIGLARRAEALSVFLERTPSDSIREEIAKLDALAARTPDAEARRQYESARLLRADELKAVGDVANARERIVANLERVIATVQGMSPKIVRVGALDVEARDALAGSMNEELDRVNGSLGDLEAALRELTTEVNAP